VHLVRDPFPDDGDRALLRVIGVGNRWRSDDAVGLDVARALAGTLPDGVEVLEREGEPASLIDAWDGAESVWLADAISSGAAAGTLHRLDASRDKLPAELFRTSTHHLGLAEAVELARALGRLPRQLVVFGVEGAKFDVGDELTPEVRAASVRAAEAIREEVLACTSTR
jgi:hydrogenase maturation protease